MWKIISLLCLSALLQIGAVQAAAQSTASSPLLSPSELQVNPNIIFIVLDDIGQMDIGIYNKLAPPTVNIDSLAQKGVHFTQAFLTTSYCSPSRASLITGMYPSQTGAPNLNDPIPEGVKTLPYFLGQAGYHTVAVGKWHMGDPSKKYFHQIVPSREESGAADWLNVLAERPKDKPFFFWLAPNDGHLNYTGWHVPYLRFDKEGEMLRPWLKKTWQDFWRYTTKLNDYFFEVRRVDQYIGGLINALANEGILDNTFIVIISDNGPEQDAKGSLYDRAILSPLIIHYPQITSHLLEKKVDALVSAVDIAPTILDVSGVDIPRQMQGYSLKPLLMNKPQLVRNWVYAEIDTFIDPNYQRLVRTDKYAYKRNYWDRNFCGKSKNYAIVSDLRMTDIYSYEELYDIQQDPMQENNIIDDAPAQLIAELRSTMNVQVNAQAKEGDIPSLKFVKCNSFLQQHLSTFLFDIGF